MSINSRPLTKRWIPGKAVERRCLTWTQRTRSLLSLSFSKLRHAYLIQSPALYPDHPLYVINVHIRSFVTTAFSLFPVFVCSYVPTFLLAPVSSLRLKYVYKSAGVKDEANTTKRASLIESLTNSEVNLISFTLKFRGKSNLLHVLDRYGSFN